MDKENYLDILRDISPVVSHALNQWKTRTAGFVCNKNEFARESWVAHKQYTNGYFDGYKDAYEMMYTMCTKEKEWKANEQ